MQTKVEINFESTDFIHNPYPTYDRLREHDPIHLADTSVWYLTRHEDVYFVMTDSRCVRMPPIGYSKFDSSSPQDDDVEHFLDNWLLFQDPPHHTALRKVLAQVVNAKLIKAMEPYIVKVTDEICADLARQTQADIVTDVAYPLSMRVMCELLGVPDIDINAYKVSSDEITLAFERSLPEDLATIAPILPSLRYYIRDIIFDRQQQPKSDWISYLLKQHLQLGEPLSITQLVDTIIFLLYSAHETTRLAMSMGCQSLIQQPQKLELLQNNPELIPQATEELLRFESPLNKISRWTTADITIRETVIPANTLVVGLVNAAHRDPEVFNEPYELNFNRPTNRHLAFGKGIHTCLGSFLARLELNLLYERIIPLLSQFEIVDEGVQWRQNSTFRYLDNLPIRLKR